MEQHRSKGITENLASTPSCKNGEERETIRKADEESDIEKKSSDASFPPGKCSRFSQKDSFEIVDGKLIRYRGENETIVLVPHGVITIGKSAFSGDNAECIEIIILPESVVHIEDFAFFSCENLRYINIPASVRTLGQYVFTFAGSLEHLYIPDGVETWGMNDALIMLDTIRLPLHLFNASDKFTNARLMIIGLPEENELVHSQDTLSLKKLSGKRLDPSYIFEPYSSSHFINGNKIIAVNGCVIQSDSSGRDYIPDSESYELKYVISIPRNTFVIPGIANALDHKCGWRRHSILYIPDSIEYIAPDAFRIFETFVTPSHNEDHLREVLSGAQFHYEIIAI